MKPRNMVVFLFCCVILSGCLKPNEDFSKNLCDEDARCSDGFTCICNMENHTKICVSESDLPENAVYASKETICMIESDAGVDVGTDVEADGNVPDAETDVQTDASSDAEQDGGSDLSPDNGTDLAPDSGEDIPCIPSTEICDLKDNDCDGDTDEDFNNLNQACSSGLGECEASGVYVCSVDGKNTTCNAVAGIAVAEECDELDNDCDGVTDEELVGCCDEDDVQECGSDVGECQKGQMTCQADGSWGQCENAVDPADDLCDNKDNDCDGNTDEDFINLNSACQIGQGVCLSHGVFACSEDGLVTECNAEIIQPSEEVCDQQDNNCDGNTDEDLVGCCTPDDQVVCGSNVGECRQGLKTCSAEGVWSECIGEVKVAEELCDSKDNNCDGFVDETFVNLHAQCQIGIGECVSTGNMICAIDQRSLSCNAEVKVGSDETCDNKDNDCDGNTDEELTRECGSDVGECQKGVQSCSAGGWLVCEGEIQSSDEICDGQDNNCDNNTDEGFNIGDQCFNGLGECRTEGVIACVDENQSACNAVAGSASEELCDGLDNDCDDLIDEELEDCCEPGTISECGIDTGECVKGTSTCLADRSWDWCFGATGPSMEECDGKDNDCDGENDNDLIGCCSPGVFRNCGIDEGECRIGTQTCWENREWGACQNQISPTDEICDGLDNNCDGFTDEDFDLTFDTNNCGSCNHICGNQGTASSICEAGECILQCSRFRFDVNADPADGCECEVTNCGVEICDQVDNDCDGAVDEDCQSLVMYLSFDNHFNDGSTNANNAVNHGATFTADAVCGQAASFDGVDDYAEVADSVSMDSIANEFTIIVSVKLRAIVLKETVFSKASQSPGLSTDSVDNGFKWIFYTSMMQKMTTAKVVSLNDWIVFVIVYVNGQLTVYADGIQVYQGFTQLQPGGIMYIASQNSVVASHKTNGVLDEFVIMNTAMNEEEINHYFSIVH